MRNSSKYAPNRSSPIPRRIHSPSITLGQTALTRIPLGPRARARLSVSEFSAPLDATYAIDEPEMRKVRV